MLDRCMTVARFLRAAGCIALAGIACGCDDGTVVSSSMSPTIAPGEKVTIDYSAYAISEPKRWDVVAFEAPGQTNETWVFRVVALPGERVDFASHGIAVNRKSLVLPVELTNITYLALDEMARRSSVVSPYVVPESSYFLLGDNSRTANDSRFIGAVWKSNILGRIRGK